MDKRLERLIKEQKRKQQKNNHQRKHSPIFRFIEYKNRKYTYANGAKQYFSSETITALQLDNKLYYIDRYTNKLSSLTLKTKIFPNIIYSESEFENFDPRLIKKYYDYKANLQKKELQAKQETNANEAEII